MGHAARRADAVVKDLWSCFEVLASVVKSALADMTALALAPDCLSRRTPVWLPPRGRKRQWPGQRSIGGLTRDPRPPPIAIVESNRFPPASETKIGRPTKC